MKTIKNVFKKLNTEMNVFMALVPLRVLALISGVDISF